MVVLYQLATVWVGVSLSALRRSAWTLFGMDARSLTEAREDQYQGGEHALCGPEDQGQGRRDTRELHHGGWRDGEMHSTEEVRFPETKTETTRKVREKERKEATETKR